MIAYKQLSQPQFKEENDETHSFLFAGGESRSTDFQREGFRFT